MTVLLLAAGAVWFVAATAAYLLWVAWLRHDQEADR